MNISNFQQCSNCGACYNVCPKGAISVSSDGLYYRPTVDQNLCVNCSKCVKVCPVNQYINENKTLLAFAGWHKDSNVVLGSSSGGVFYGIAQSIISQDGVVYAAVFSDDYKTVQFASSDDVPLDRMLKSKYVESCVGFSFQKIKMSLEVGRKVLFCGTPCQVAGLHGYLGKAYDTLLTCDFACGGLPSHKMYHEYLSDIESRYHSTIQQVDFRPKTYGWKRYAIRVLLKNGKQYLRLGTEDPYLGSFLYGKYTVRDYCLECKFPGNHRSDITIADFWLHQKYSSLMNNDGISLILCNTTKGIDMINTIKEQYVMSEIEVENATYNHQINISKTKKKNHDDFIKYYDEHGLNEAYRQYLPLSVRDRLHNLLVRMLLKNKGNRR